MASVQYQVFCRYLNNSVNRAITNKTKVEWHDAETYDALDAVHKSKIDKGVEKKTDAREYCIIRPEVELTDYEDKQKAISEDSKLYELIVEQTRATNEKYDMIFLYDGIGTIRGEKGPEDYDNEPIVLYDKMKRIKSDPWFLYSTHASLNSAMTKARELANILGVDGIKIGKVVPLEQYIEIV